MPPRRGNSGGASRTPRRPRPLPNARQGRRTNVAPRYKPPPKYIQEIRYLQTVEKLLIPHQPFGKLVREIAIAVTSCNELRFQATALRALHEASEAYIVGLLEDSYLCSLHSKRVTLMAKDIRLAYKIRGDFQRYGA